MRKWMQRVGLMGIVAVGVCWGPTPCDEAPVYLIKIYNQVTQYKQSNPNVTMSIMYSELDSERTLKWRAKSPHNPASVIKLPIIIAVYKQIETGALKLTDRVKLTRHHKQKGSGKIAYYPVGRTFSIETLIKYTIKYSDNTATKMLIDTVGIETINHTIKELGLHDTVLGTSNLLAAEGLNMTTVSDITSLLKRLYKGELINQAISEKIALLMQRQAYRWGIPRYIPGDVTVMNKTGSLRNRSNDVGIILKESGPYSLSIFVTGKISYLKLRKIIADISKTVWDQSTIKSIAVLK